jgi:hypothetical protein
MCVLKVGSHLFGSGQFPKHLFCVTFTIEAIQIRDYAGINTSPKDTKYCRGNKGVRSLVYHEWE